MEYKEVLVETTGTVGDFTYPPHTYYLNEAGKLVGFKSAFTGVTTWFMGKPLMFDKARRKFKKEKV